MSLRSLMLKDDVSLQACLERDKDHVVPGATGNHVAKIQKALLLLEQAGIQQMELRSKLYGATTAAAVLASKRKRGIFNPSYQTAADNIVGKMTIARLDTDLQEIERRVTPNRTVCGGARELLAPHGIDFTGGPFPEFGPTVPDFERVIPGSPASCFSVREAAENVLPGHAMHLRVICCPFDEKGAAFGVTDGGTLAGRTFPKFCLINVQKRNPDLGTLLHEMIHAAKVVSVAHDGSAQSVFSESSGRTILPPQHAESLANAFFSTVRF